MGRSGSQALNRATINWQKSLPQLSAAASLIGVGVALGVGLFAARRRWLPPGADWGDARADSAATNAVEPGSGSRDDYRWGVRGPHNQPRFPDGVAAKAS